MASSVVCWFPDRSSWWNVEGRSRLLVQVGHNPMSIGKSVHEELFVVLPGMSLEDKLFLDL